MPQVFHVLCCYKCNIFQVHIVKKAKKWQCKVCNEKQSLIKAFKIGSAPECRSLVQELNLRKAEMNESTSDSENFSDSNLEDECDLYPADASNAKDLEVSCTSLHSPFKSNGKDVNSTILSHRKNKCPSSLKFDDGSAVRQDCGQNSSLCGLNKINDVDTSHRECSIEKSKTGTLPGKRQLENNLSTVISYPPVKKNRGFLLIKNAASKLP